VVGVRIFSEDLDSCSECLDSHTVRTVYEPLRNRSRRIIIIIIIVIAGQDDEGKEGLADADIIPPVFTRKTFREGGCA
jgi:hypothetical protein